MDYSSVCEILPENVDWLNPTSILKMCIIAFIIVIVVIGNMMTVAAVANNTKLRTITNHFIVSLAAADLMVGVLVLPFSAVWEVYKVWIFGRVWCSVWLSVDVWMCTASILNLVAISLDRFLAITQPVKYPSLMSSKRAKTLIVAVWIVSFAICLPPLVGWKDKKITIKPRNPNSENNTINYLVGSTLSSTLDDVVPELLESTISCPYTCELTNEPGYVIYSACGSFFIPSVIMCFFYLRIFIEAQKAQKSINQGFKTTKSSKSFGNRFDDQRLTLRIHRGRSVKYQGSGSNSGTTTNENSTNTSTCGSPSNLSTAGKSPECPRFNRSSMRRIDNNKPHEKVKISVSYPSSDALCAVTTNGVPSPPSPNSSKKSSVSSSPPNSVALYAVHNSGPNGRETTTSAVYKNRESNSHLRVTGPRVCSRRNSRRSSSTDSAMPGSQFDDTLSVNANKDLSPSPTFDDSIPGVKSRLISKIGKRNIKPQRMKVETKAAKTLGIIVGCFICCWFPFFISYVIRAFYPDSIPDLLFSIFFWLGYCNSALNPCIYALFSKDFRFAFKRMICQIFCTSVQINQKDRYRRRGSDGSQLGSRMPLGSDRARSPSYNISQQFPGTDDSDQNIEGSDSR